MRQFFIASVLVLACSGMAFASAQAAKPAKAEAKAAKTVASHSTSGVVKSVDGSTLVITRGNKDMTFATNGSTQKAGTLAPGAHVTVRYQTEGKTMVATAITEQTMAKVSTKKK